MRRFEDLLRPVVLRKEQRNHAEFASVGNTQRALGTELTHLLEQSNLLRWKPGGPIPYRGRRVLIGVASWSRHDLQLLDALNEASADGRIGADCIQIFDFFEECRVQEDLDRFIPGLHIQAVFHTPLIGIWEDGVLVNKASGAAVRRMLAAQYRL